MKAVLCKAYGPPSGLVLEDIDAPALKAGEVRVAVHACGVNFPDTLIIQGLYQIKPPLPFSPGMEVAGVVLECAEGVTHLRPGDRVLALPGQGGFAEQVIVEASAVTLIPPEMDFVTAAGFALTYSTSHVALTHRAQLQPGETLLVHGAAGGVGLTAVELGKLLGATVIACASTPEKLQLAAEYGADYLINYTEESIRDRVKALTGGKGAHVIYDPVGGEVFDQSVRCIAWEGRLLVIGFASGTIPQLPVNLALLKNCSVVGVFWGAYRQNNPQVIGDSLQTLLGWYSDGKLRPHISQTFPLERAADALYTLMNREARGKIVVTMDQARV